MMRPRALATVLVVLGVWLSAATTSSQVPTAPIPTQPYVGLNQAAFEQALQLEGENFLFPILIHTIERYLRGVTDTSNVDRAFATELARHPEITRAMLQRIVDAWYGVSAETRQRITPPGLRGLAIETKLGPAILAGVFPAPLDAVAQQLRPGLSPSLVPAPGALSRMSLQEVLLGAMVHPRITDLVPQKAFYLPNEQVDILGTDFSPQASKNRVIIYVDFYGQKAKHTTLSPSLTTSTALRITLPKEIKAGLYYFAVETLSKQNLETTETWKTSYAYSFSVGTPPPPKPVISSMNPASQLPGSVVYVNGQNFDKSRETLLVWEPLDFPALPHGTVDRVKAEVLTTKQLKVTLPEKILPGRYGVWVHMKGVGDSDRKTFTFSAPSYRLIFTRIHCLDETDPEGGDDAMVTDWAVIADTSGYGKGTDEYSFDENGVRDSGCCQACRGKAYGPVDRLVFSGPIGVVLAAHTVLWEMDSGDNEAWSQVVGVVAAVGTAIASAIPGAQWVGPVIQAAAVVVEALIKLNGDDCLGRKTLTWSALDLQNKTAAAGWFAGSLFYLGHGGQYWLHFTICRAGRMCPPDHPYFTIVNKLSGKCLDVQGPSKSPRANVHQWEIYGGVSQRWMLLPRADGAFALINSHSDLALDVASPFGAGANIYQDTLRSKGQDPLPTKYQFWELRPVDSKYYLIVNRQTGMCVEVVGGKATNGTNIQQSAIVAGKASQLWELRPVSAP